MGATAKLKKIINGTKLKQYQELVERIPVPEHVFELAVDLVRRTRPGTKDAPKWLKQSVQWGAGPRAIQFLIRGAKAHALISGNFITTTDDLEAVAEPVLYHRIITTSMLVPRDHKFEVIRRLLEEAHEEALTGHASQGQEALRVHRPHTAISRLAGEPLLCPIPWRKRERSSPEQPQGIKRRIRRIPRIHSG